MLPNEKEFFLFLEKTYKSVQIGKLYVQNTKAHKETKAKSTRIMQFPSTQTYKMAKPDKLYVNFSNTQAAFGL